MDREDQRRLAGEGFTEQFRALPRDQVAPADVRITHRPDIHEIGRDDKEPAIARSNGLGLKERAEVLEAVTGQERLPISRDLEVALDQRQ